MIRLLIVSLFTLLVACASQVKENTIILNYSDFGPQVIASEIIGMEWWQWQAHGESRPTSYNIKVVVFKNISLKEVNNLYPVNSDTQKDYRYLKYEEALNYLDSKIDDNVMKKVTYDLKATRAKLILKFKK